MAKSQIVVLGTMASNPYAGMAWMHMQIVVGLLKLGHEAYYMEVTSIWPFDPVQNQRLEYSGYTVPYLSRIAKSFGIENRWALRRSYSDGQWFGMNPARAKDLLKHSDLVLNVAGATNPRKEGLDVGRLVYFGTDPVVHELAYNSWSWKTRRLIAQHEDVVTYGENIGTDFSAVPPLPRLRGHTRQPVLMDYWKSAEPTRAAYTTIGNWRQDGRDVKFKRTRYHWSKHHEFEKFLDLPARVKPPLELAMNLADPRLIEHGPKEIVKAFGVEPEVQDELRKKGWKLANGAAFSTDPWSYRDYIVASRAEFTVARDLNVRLRSGWFSERSACYLAAGRPVITQDTGFGTVLPTGEGLFAFNTMDEILQAIDKIETNYEKQSAAARDIAREYFEATKVLSRLLDDLG